MRSLYKMSVKDSVFTENQAAYAAKRVCHVYAQQDLWQQVFRWNQAEGLLAICQ